MGYASARSAERVAAMIGAAKPHLAPKIARRIMRVERVKFATPERRNVAIGHALTALGRLAELLPDTKAVRQFAARQVGNPRPATSKKAQKLLK